MERRRRVAVKLVLFGAVGVAAVAVWQLAKTPAPSSGRPVPGEQTDVVVEVLNATAVDGLARTVTDRLRSAGIDVVYYGSARDSMLDSTRIIVRRGDSTKALLVHDVLGTGVIEVWLDPKLLVDVTVLLHLDAAAVLGLHP